MSDLRVLVVEDEGIIAKDIQSTLNRSGYSVIAVASSGQEAIEKAMEMYPDLVLMDIVLEGDMDGVAAAEKIRDRFDTPVVYLTAYSDDTTLQRAKITEPYGYILKPFQERELYTTIEMALYKHKIERKLKENERWVATLLKSIGDAVIATDTSKLITFMNPVAEALTGWKHEEAVGKPIKDVFKIINEKTGKEVEESATRLLQDRVVTGITNHAVLIAKDGTKRPIDDSCAPIRDDKGRIIGVVLTFRDITETKRMQDSILKSEKQLRNLSSSILSAQEQERKRISRELHDDLGQILTAVLLDISRAEKQETILSSSSYGFLEHIRVGIKEALQRVRSLSAILRPGILDQLGLKAAVISFLEEIQEQTGLKIIEEMQVDQSNIPESVSIAIYRILQEATTNIVKHAEAKQVIVKLQSDSKTISISIKDDGKGFKLESLPIDKGLGLLGMKERAEWLGGVFKIESAHSRGTSICAEFPLFSKKLAT